MSNAITIARAFFVEGAVRITVCLLVVQNAFSVLYTGPCSVR